MPFTNAHMVQNWFLNHAADAAAQLEAMLPQSAQDALEQSIRTQYRQAAPRRAALDQAAQILRVIDETDLVDLIAERSANTRDITT